MIGNATRRTFMRAVAGAAVVAMGRPAAAQTPLKVIVFPTLSNLAQFAAQSQGYYSKRGLAVDLIYTPNSDELRYGLAQGRYDIAHAGVDNAVAQVETDKVDLFVFMGGNSGLNSLIAQSDIRSYEDLRGKTLAVDSPVTAFALLMYKMLEVKGLKRGDYAAAILSPPFTIQAQNAGLKDLGAAVDVIGPYQSDAGWVLRSWGEAHADTLVRYIQANIEGIRFALDPANRAVMTALVAERMKLPQDIVARTLQFAVDQKGFATDAKFDMVGFRNALKLRADMLGTWGGTPPAPEKYLDLSYYQRAIAGL